MHALIVSIYETERKKSVFPWNYRDLSGTLGEQKIAVGTRAPRG